MVTSQSPKSEGPDEQFVLKWNDFENDMADSFKDLRDEKAFCDVTISAEGQQLQAHKVVVSACSPFFKKMIEFQQKEKHPLIVLNDVSFLHMSAILEFMYNGEVNVTQEELPDFLKTAEKLEIKGLAEDEKEIGGENGEDEEEYMTTDDGENLSLTTEVKSDLKSLMPPKQNI